MKLSYPRRRGIEDRHWSLPWFEGGRGRSEGFEKWHVWIYEITSEGTPSPFLGSPRAEPGRGREMDKYNKFINTESNGPKPHTYYPFISNCKLQTHSPQLSGNWPTRLIHNFSFFFKKTLWNFFVMKLWKKKKYWYKYFLLNQRICVYLFGCFL